VKRRAALALLAGLLLTGCASGPPTLKFETRGFLLQYMTLRDEFMDSTYPARIKCRRLEPVASEATKAKCSDLATKLVAWQTRDQLVLQAVLSQGTITTEQIQAAMSAGKELLGLALTIAPLLAL
jgi:hypothetical protein